MYAANSWRLTYGPEKIGMGRYDDISLTFDGEKLVEIVLATSFAP